MTLSDYIDSYYRRTKVPTADFPALDKTIEADVLVVGGGFAGLTAARELLKARQSVVLLESHKVGWGASGRNGGFVSDGYALGILELEKKLGYDHAKQLFDLSKMGTNYVRHAISDLAAEAVEPMDGWLRVLRYSDEERLRRSVLHLGEAYDAHYGFVPTERVREALVSERYYQGIVDPDAFHIQPLNYALALAEDIRRSGGQIFEASEARALSRERGHWEISSQTGHKVRAGTVLLCGSAYLQDLYPKLERAVLPVATYVITSEPMASKLSNAIRYNGCIGDTRRAGDYYRLVDDGSRLLWGGRITTSRSEPKALADMLKRDILSIYPQLGDFRIDHAWSGLMGYCVHKMPVVRQLEPGLWTATASGGHGLNTTATLGVVVAEAIAGQSDRYRLFEPFGVRWGGGPIGRLGTQLSYWGLQMMDWWDEFRA